MSDSEMRETIAAQRFVVVKSSWGAGLGDKLRELVAGLLLAKYDRRSLFVDWSDGSYAPRGINLFPELFRLEGVSSCAQCPVLTPVAPSVWEGRLGLSKTEVRRHDLREQGVTWDGDFPPWDHNESFRRYSWQFDEDQADYPVLVVNTLPAVHAAVSWLKRRRVLPASATLDDVMAESLRNHLGFHLTIESEVARLRQELGLDASTVAVHVRMTNEAAANRTVPSLEAYLKATERMLESTGGERLFVATDNAGVLSAFEREFSHVSVRYCRKWFAEPGESLHKNSAAPDGIQCAREAVIDLLLLAGCGALVSLGNSSFSMIAAALSVAAPERRMVMFPSSKSSRLRTLLRYTLRRFLRRQA